MYTDLEMPGGAGSDDGWVDGWRLGGGRAHFRAGGDGVMSLCVV